MEFETGRDVYHNIRVEGGRHYRKGKSWQFQHSSSTKSHICFLQIGRKLTCDSHKPACKLPLTVFKLSSCILLRFLHLQMQDTQTYRNLVVACFPTNSFRQDLNPILQRVQKCHGLRVKLARYVHLICFSFMEIIYRLQHRLGSAGSLRMASGDW